MTRLPTASRSWSGRYWIVAGAFMLGSPLLAGAALGLLAVLAPSGPDETWMNVFASIGAIGEIAGFFMLFWLCPWYESANAKSRWRGPPRAVVRGLKILVWVPWYIVAGYVLVFLAIQPWVNARLLGERDWQGEQTAGVVMLILLAPMGAWCTWLARRIAQRARATGRVRQICFACGYDLRGNPDASCPECGYTDAAEGRRGATFPGGAREQDGAPPPAEPPRSA